MTIPPREGWSPQHDALAQAAGHRSWERWCASIEERKGFEICGRMSRAKRSPCELKEAWGVPEKPKGACKLHGGKSPAGTGSASYKNGQHSRAPSVVGSSLRSRIEKFLHVDPRRTLEIGVAALMARLEQLVERLEDGGVGPEGLSDVRELFQEMGATREPERLAELLREVRGIVESASNADQVWTEIYQVVDRIRGGAEALRKVTADAGELVETPRALALFDRFATDVAGLLDELPLSDVEKREARVKLSAIVSTYLQRSLPPASSGNGNGAG